MCGGNSNVHFSGIDIPTDLVQAHADGGVVFFVGAGASVSPPTSLPLFDELARRVAKAAGRTCTAEDAKSPDEFLGRLDTVHHVPVNTFVAQELGQATTRNKNHDAIAILSAASGTARIVTTNYDPFISSSLEHMGVAHEVYSAPALPMGDDFEGVVHIHGSLRQPPNRLVVSDRDFGKAYLSQAWATNFLRALFGHFTVCFVGYSHKDRMMEYLARGLSSESKARYAFTDTPESPQWLSLGITPIGYPLHDHETLTTVLSSWGTWATSTPLQRAHSIESLMAGAPPADPNEQDFLAHALADPILVREVCRHAVSPEWYQWLASQTAFAALFSSIVDDNTIGALVDWFAACAANPATSEIALQTALRSTGEPNMRLVEQIIWQISQSQLPDEFTAPWLRWSLDEYAISPTPVSGIGLGQIWTSTVPLDEIETLSLLSSLTMIRRQPIRTSFHDRADYDVVSEDWILSEGIQNRLTDKLTTSLARGILHWATTFFENGHHLFTSGANEFDSWNFSRSAIEEHDQNRYSLFESVDALIDLTRTAIEKSVSEADAVGTAYIAIWQGCSAPLLQRLALHAQLVRRDISATEKVATVIDNNWLFSIELQHEVFAVLETTWVALRGDERTPLLDALNRGPQSDLIDEPDLRDRMIYERLHWLKRIDPDENLEALLEQIENRHNWEPRENADFSVWTSDATWSAPDDHHRLQPSELHRMINENAIEVATTLLDETGTDYRQISGRTDLVTTVVAEWPTDGVALWPHVLRNDRIAASVISGWAAAALDSQLARKILNLLRGAQTEQLCNSVASLLGPRASNQPPGTIWSVIPEARALARSTWAHIKATTSQTSSDDLLTAALNNPGGRLAEFWIEAASREARADPDIESLPEEIRDALNEILLPTMQGRFGAAMLLTQLRFFHAIDSTWTKGKLLPLLAIGAHPSPESDSYWCVVLRNAQLDESLLEAGLRTGLVNCAERAGPGTSLSKKLPAVLAVATVQSPVGDARRLDWMFKVTANAHAELRADWFHRIANLTKDLDVDQRGKVWTRWMRPYLANRAQGRPLQLASVETVPILAWIAGLGGRGEIGEGGEYLRDAAVGISTDGYRPFPLTDQTLDRAPNEWASTLSSLLIHTDTLPRWGHAVQRAMQRLQSAGASQDDIEKINERLFELGIRQ